jgi:succinyl-CoA synthetase beta subunit
MNIHEYQARELFEKFGVATTRGAVASTPDEAAAVATGLGTKEFVVKAQIHAGGRGKGTFTNGFKGGVHITDSVEKVREFAGKMLGQTLVTHQTGPEGKLVSKVLIAEPATIERELYFAILLDRASGAPVVIASTAGGVDIESVAEHTPEKIFREPIHPTLGLQPFQTRKIAHALGLTGKQIVAAAKLFSAMFKLFLARDCSQIEVNPLVITKTGELLALDAKFNFDDNALYRQPEIVALRDKSEEDPREVAASEFNLNYIGLDGNIACLVNGAGLAMATMDIIQYAGGKPANFLDVGGGASKERSKRGRHSGQYFRRHHGLQYHRHRHPRRGQGNQSQHPARRPPRGQQCRGREEDPRGERPRRDRRQRSRRRREKDRRRRPKGRLIPPA